MYNRQVVYTIFNYDKIYKEDRRSVVSVKATIKRVTVTIADESLLSLIPVTKPNDGSPVT